MNRSRGLRCEADVVEAGDSRGIQDADDAAVRRFDVGTK